MKCDWCDNVRLPVCLLVVLFGMGSWIAINGMWVELPILVDQLPEGWNLPSYMTVIIQIANIGPITYTILNLLFPRKIGEKPVVYVMVVVGSLASLLLAFFWTKTSVIAGEEHSTGLLVLMFFLSLVDCTSSVVFLPFMNIFKSQYMTSYFIGEGFSGLVPSLVSLGQGVGQVECVNVSFLNKTSNETEYQIQGRYLPPKFPVEDFFFFLFAMMVVCGFSFTALNYLPYCKKEHANVRSLTSDKSSSRPDSDLDEYDLDPDPAVVNHSTDQFLDPAHLPEGGSPRHGKLIITSGSPDHGITIKGMSRLKFAYYLILTGLANALTNGVLPSVQSYACLPYGSSPYHLSVTLANIANPVACFLAFFVPIDSSWVLGLVTFIGSGISVYILMLAESSPEPPLVDMVIGSILVIAAYVIVFFLLTFSKVTIATLLRVEGRKALLWFGVVTQLGSAVGAAVMFVIINVLKLFVQKYPCT